MLSELGQFIGSDIVLIAFILGTWLAITAVYVPGTGIPEVLAVSLLIAAGFGLWLLSANPIGILMLIAATGCFLALLFYKDLWYLILAGGILQFSGSLFLFPADLRPNIWLILLLNSVTLAFHQFILKPGLSVEGKTKWLDADTLVGEVGEVITAIDPVGTVRIHGELWRARSADTEYLAGTFVTVTRRNGLELIVQAQTSEPAAT